MRVIHLVKYTPEALAALRSSSSYAERERQAHELMEALGGKVLSISWTLHDDWDAINIVELPDEATVFDMHATVRASGAIERSEFVFARTSDEADAAMGLAEKYPPPPGR